MHFRQSSDGVFMDALIKFERYKVETRVARRMEITFEKP
jgi:hypothetical protein